MYVQANDPGEHGDIIGPAVIVMKFSRRHFIEAAAAAAGLGGLAGCAAGGATGQPSANRLTGAPGVELNFDRNGLPDYSRDLERYLVRLTGEARERRKRVVDGISTAQQVADRQKQVVAEIWAMLGGPFAKTPLNPRVTGTIQRPGYRIEKVAFEPAQLFVTANLYGNGGGRCRPFWDRRTFSGQQGVVQLPKLFSNLARKGYVVLADRLARAAYWNAPGAAGLTALAPAAPPNTVGRAAIRAGRLAPRHWTGCSASTTAESIRPPDAAANREWTLTQLAALEPRIGQQWSPKGTPEPGTFRRRAARLGRRPSRTRAAAAAASTGRPSHARPKPLLMTVAPRRRPHGPPVNRQSRICSAIESLRPHGRAG